MKRRIGSADASRTATKSIFQFNWQHLLLMIVCGAVLAAGFFFAARQHFMSMDYGFKNSKLKKQLEGLEAEKRRLILAREVSLSPSELRKSARLAAVRSKAPAANAIPTSAKATPQNDKLIATVQAGPVEGPAAQGKVIRTVYSEPVRTDSTEKKSPAGGSNEKERRPGTEIAAVAKLR